MIEDYIGKEAAEDIFVSSALVNSMSEKQADACIELMEKKAFMKSVAKFLKSLAGGIWNVGGKAINVGANILKSTPGIIGGTALLGSGAGILGANLYDVLKEQVSHDDPEEKFNEEVESMYLAKSRELDDEAWMNDVRNMRNELIRGYKKMTAKEYREKYDELMSKIEERA